LAIVEADPGAIALAPEILSRAAAAFDRAGDSAAAAYCRRRGREILDQQLNSIEGSDRVTYLALRWHAALGDGTQGRPSTPDCGFPGSGRRVEEIAAQRA
jgi:hypothetical protein